MSLCSLTQLTGKALRLGDLPKMTQPENATTGFQYRMAGSRTVLWALPWAACCHEFKDGEEAVVSDQSSHFLTGLVFVHNTHPVLQRDLKLSAFNSY
jgi:hypothetical protein